MKRQRFMPRMSRKRRADLAAQGVERPMSTFASGKPGSDTGSDRSVVRLLLSRSGGVCEWPSCRQVAIHKHHRLNRKAGGRHGEAAERVNGVQWLLHICGIHHLLVTSSSGTRRQIARSWGWVLHEYEDAATVPVWTRHHDAPVWLLADGNWVPVEEDVGERR